MISWEDYAELFESIEEIGNWIIYKWLRFISL